MVREATLQSTIHKLMTSTKQAFYAVRIDFGDRVQNTQFQDRTTAEMVLQQARAQYGYDNAALVEVHYWRTRAL